MSLTADAVRALAPDAGALKSGQTLANARHWSSLGRSERAFWGRCQGSGKEPYQVMVDLAGPVTKCTCPSRKFPCKHGIGLMLLGVSGGGVGVAAEPEDVAAWLTDRAKRAAAAAERTAAVPAAGATAATPEDAEKAARARERDRQRRQAQREERVTAGMDDFRRWLRDLARRGLADVDDAGTYEAAAARLVDAQAGELARDVRALGRLIAREGVGGDDVLDRIGLLFLISETWDRRERLDERLGSELRTRIGWTTREADLPEADDIADRWFVVARRHEDDDRLRETRTWLRGADTGRWTVILDFAPVRTAPANEPPVGAVVDGRVAFHPGASGLRGALRTGWQTVAGAAAPDAHEDFDTALASYRSAVGTDPFLERWPWAVTGVRIAWDRDRGRLALVDTTGNTLPARIAGIGVSPLIAFAGGTPVTIAGEWDGHAFDVLAAGDGEAWIALPGTERATTPAIADSGVPPPPPGPAWDAVRALATLGTGRAEPDAVLAPLTARMADRVPEDRLLALVSALSVRARVGRKPTAAPADLAILPPAPTESLRRPPPAVARAIAEPHERLREERFAVLAKHGWLVPPELLLTEFLAKPPRDSAILGQRATWLSRFIGGYRPVGADIEDVDVPEIVARLDDPATGLIERQSYLRAFRRLDPAAARTWLEGAWDGLRANDKSLVSTLEVGLSDADLPFLESVGQEKNRDRRAAAGRLMARLPASTFVRRIEARGRSLVERKGRFGAGLRLVTPPDTLWAELEADGHAVSTLQWTGGPARTPDDRTWDALDWHLRLIRPARWTEWLGLDMLPLIEQLYEVSPKRWGSGPVPALSVATVMHRDPAFAVALIATGAMTGQDDDLWDLIPPRERPPLVFAALRRKQSAYEPEDTLRSALRAIDGAWTPELREVAVEEAQAAIGHLGDRERWQALARTRALVLTVPVDLLPGIMDRLGATDADSRDIIELADARRRFAALVDEAGEGT